MKKTNSKLKTNVLNRAVSITALLVAAALLFTGCPQKVKKEPKPVYYTISLVHEGGSLTANPALQGGKALKNSEITFTASPANSVSHEVDKWEVTGGQVLEGGGEGSASVKVKITANTTVKVTFKLKPVYYTVSLVHVGGTLTANPEIQGGKALKDSEITFTASPANALTHEVDKWEVTGGTKISGGEDGSISVKVKITANTTVKVTFKKKPHSLILKTLSIFGKNAISGRIIVDNSKTEVTIGDVSASFDYGSVTGETIPVSITNGTLNVGENTVNLSIAAVEGKYEAWTKDIVVSRQEAAPIDKTYTVSAVGFTMKGIAAVKNAPLGHDDYDDNKPHTVSLSAYLIGETEVTQELWQEVMGNNPSWFDGSSGKEPAEGEAQGKRPVEKVNWYQAIAFCNKLSLKLGLVPCYTVKKGGNPVNFESLTFDQIPILCDADWDKAELDMNKNGFRLPTEAEREWAAKGGKDYKWAGTDTEAELKNYAWYSSNSGGKTHEVKKKDPNGYGLYDMSGNVFEWCCDWYGTIPASLGADYAGPASGSARVYRGSSWNFGALYCTVGCRSYGGAAGRSANVGLRLACRQ